MQKFLDFISSKMFRNAVCFLLFTGLMTAAISSQNFFFQKIIENNTAKKTIEAKKDIKIIDIIKTEQHKKEVAQNIEPILTQAEDEFITTSLHALKNTVYKIRNKDVADSVKREELKVLFDESNKGSLVDFLLRSEESELQYVFEKANETLNSVLNVGVSYKDFVNNNVTNIIRKHLPSNITRYKSSLIIEILNQIIVPNLVIDEVATEIAKQNAQDSVKPYEVVYKKGQIIVSKEDPVYRLQRDALRAAGYNVLEVNFAGILGIFVLVSIFTLIFLQYEKNYEKQYYNARHLFLMASFTLLLSLIAAVLPTGFSPYIIPIPAYTILIAIFTNPRNAFFASTIILALIAIGMHFSIEVIVSFMLLNTAIVTVVSKLKFSKRSDLLLTSIKISLAGLLIVGGIYFLEKFMMNIDNTKILWDLGLIVANCFVIGGILILGMLPIIEYTFKIMTPYGLAELIDHPLMKKLLQEAPGTYNHSLIVSQLVEAASEAVGANPILARVGAMYHDIGKLMRPMFFVENQSFYGIENPHNNCNSKVSKMIITAHPKDGVELAKDKEYKLPQIIHNFILQHHGTSLVSYFYNQAVKEEGEENVNEEQFRYPGPKPNMKETAILMIADAVESAVRAAKNPSNEEVDAIINGIIKERLNDGQLEESPLTLKDLKTIAETFSRMLRGMHHKRIKYHNDLVQELDKSKPETDGGVDELKPVVLDADLESKIKELENKKHDNI